MLPHTTPDQLKLLQPPVGWWPRLAGAVVRRWLALRYRTLSRRYDSLVLEEIDGVPLLVLSQVFNPVLLRTGSFMAQAIMNDRPEQSWSQKRVLDLGTGSGVGAVFAARRGAQVTAVDINPEAVRCAHINALLNKFDQQITVLQGDLFTSVQGQQFDLIFFNPPFYRGQPRHNLDHAWRGDDVFERFASQLAAMLTPTGEARLVLSSDGNCDELLTLLQQQNFSLGVIAHKNFINERVIMYQVQVNR